MRHAALTLLAALLPACFEAPAADVMFSCDPAAAPACPDGYSCEADGCCHRDGSDVTAHLGECKLQGGSEAGTTLITATGSSSGEGSSGSSGTQGSTGGASTGTTADASSSSEASSGDTSSSTDAGSSSTGASGSGSSSTG